LRRNWSDFAGQVSNLSGPSGRVGRGFARPTMLRLPPPVGLAKPRPTLQNRGVRLRNFFARNGFQRTRHFPGRRPRSGTLLARSQAAESETATKEQRDHLKARVTALDAVLKDIRNAEKEIAARKTDDAKASVKAAIAGLEGLTGHEPKKKK